MTAPLLLNLFGTGSESYDAISFLEQHNYPFARNPNSTNLAGNLRPQRRREQRQLREELHR
jgi:hypothetical protein